MSSASPSDTESASQLDLARTLSFFFEDPNWIHKLLVGSLFAFLAPALVGTVFIVGYSVHLARQTMKRSTGAPGGLPEWDDLQGIFVDGLKGVAISLAHKIPLFLFGMLMLFALFGGVLLERQGGGDFSETLLGYGLPLLFSGWVLIFLLSLLILGYVPAAFVRFIQTDRLAAAFDVADNIEFIRDNSANYVIALLGILLAVIIGQLGIVLFCVGVFPTTFWSVCTMGYVCGELARLDVSPPKN